ncbi:hypothetical protein SESBI_09592 [Sesbania bispinosa]|nr:hypothetical protein SESBI_09592 [Sesbania bispinosa]
MARALSETDLYASPKLKPFNHHLFDEDEGIITSHLRTTSLTSVLFSFSELDEKESGVGSMD